MKLSASLPTAAAWQVDDTFVTFLILQRDQLQLQQPSSWMYISAFEPCVQGTLRLAGIR